MGLLSLQEDRPTPKAVYGWRVYACAAVASFASCTIGYDSAFIGTTLALPSFGQEFGFATMPPARLRLLKQDIVSVYQAGALVGSLAAYAAGHLLGRRHCLLLFSLVFIVGAGMMLGASADRGTGLIIGGRVLAGFGVGGCSNLTPVYIAELAPPAVRGRLVGIYELGWQIGGLAGFWINYAVSLTMRPDRAQWLVPFAVQLVPAGLLLVGVLLIPESPRWLLSRGRRDDALRELCWIRQLPRGHPYLVEELSRVDAELDRFRTEVGVGFWKPFLALREGRMRWRLLLGGLLFVFQNGSGINAINYYSPTVFRSIGITGTTTSFLTTGIFGLVKTVLTIVWLLFLIDHLGRRRLLMVGALGGSLCMWFLGAFIKLAGTGSPAAALDATPRRLTAGSVSAVVVFYLWAAFYTPSWNGTPWVINAEMFDQSTRSLGQANAAANNWFWNFLVARFTEQMFAAWGYGVYFFFALLMLVSVVFVFFCVPETKALPLEAMDRLFAIKPVWRAQGVLMGELAREGAAAAAGPVLAGGGGGVKGEGEGAAVVEVSEDEGWRDGRGR